MKITNFTDLVAWKQSHQLALDVYQATKKFPKEELYCLTPQMRRCVISIGSNIAEGFSRKTKKDKAHFYSTAKGSLTELQNQLLLARDLGYISTKQFHYLAQQTISVSKLLTGLTRSAKTK